MMTRLSLIRLRTWLLAGALVFLAAGCARKKEQAPSVIFIVIDTLRADHLGCMGYREARSPVLDGLAAQGVLFKNAFSAVPVTLPSVSSILTGRYPFHNGVRDNERFVLPPEETTLPERLRAAGFRTGAVVGSAVLSSDRGLDQGFEIYDDRFGDKYVVYQPTRRMFAESFADDRRRADLVTSKAIRILDVFGEERYFLFVHYFDVHSYYDPPPRFDAMHPGRPYDGEISFVDEEIGRLLFRARENGNDPLVVVVADHGEGLGQHGESEHGFLLYQTTLHVPIIVSGAGLPAGVVREDPVSLVDVEPTLAGWLGLSKVSPARDGRALSWTEPETDEQPLYAETFRTLISYHWAELRAVVEGKWKMIEGAGVTELYDLDADPAEQDDLGAVDPAPRLQEDLTRMTGGETRADVLASLQEDVDPNRRELLESLGYVGASEVPTRDPEREYKHPREELPAWFERQKTKGMYQLAVTLATKGDYEKSIAVFDSVITRGREQADVYYNRGVARYRTNDTRGFLRDMNRAVELDSTYIPALAMLAQADQESGRKTRALKLWRKVQSLQDDNVDALRALAEWNLSNNDPEAALPYLRTLVSKMPEDPTARYNLGLAASRSGHAEEAIRHLKVFVEMEPADPRIPKVQELIDQLGGG